MFNFKEAFKSVGDTIMEHSQTAMGIGALLGLAGVIILTYKKSPAIHQIVDEQRQKRECLDKNEELTDEEYEKASKDITKETFTKVAKEAAPIAACTLATAGLTIGSVVTSEHKIGELTHLLGLEQIYNKEIIDKAKEVVGEDKAREIQDKVSEDRMRGVLRADPDMRYIQQAKGGHDLFWDVYNARFFYSDINTVTAAINTVNARILNGPHSIWHPLKEVYQELDLKPGTGSEYIGAGGFNCSVSQFEWDPEFAHALVIDDVPAIMFEFRVCPKPEKN